MTFKNIKKTKNTTVVFFPTCLAGSLVNALTKDGITDWKILKPHEAQEEFEIQKLPIVNLYNDPDLPSPTKSIRAFVSHFDEIQILDAIYKLHDDPDAMAYRDQQAQLVEIALKQDGMLD